MSNNNIKNLNNSSKPSIDLQDLIDTSIWMISDDIVIINNDKIPIISSIKEISLYEAIYVMALNNVSVIKKNNINMLEPLENLNLNNISIPSSSKLVTKENFKTFFKNCHELINEKTYVLNSKKFNINHFTELQKYNLDKFDDLPSMIGGSTSNIGEVSAIINTMKINNMLGGKLTFYSNPNETKNLIKTVEENFKLDNVQKNRIHELLDKHNVYTIKLNKLNDTLKKFNILTKTNKKIPTKRVSKAVEQFEKVIQKNKRNNKNMYDFIESSLGIKKSNTIYSIKYMNLRDFPFHHLEKIVTKKFNKVKNLQKSKFIKSQMENIEDIEKLVDELTTTVNSIENEM